MELVVTGSSLHRFFSLRKALSVSLRLLYVASLMWIQMTLTSQVQFSELCSILVHKRQGWWLENKSFFLKERCDMPESSEKVLVEQGVVFCCFLHYSSSQNKGLMNHQHFTLLSSENLGSRRVTLRWNWQKYFQCLLLLPQKRLLQTQQLRNSLQRSCSVFCQPAPSQPAWYMCFSL